MSRKHIRYLKETHDISPGNPSYMSRKHIIYVKETRDISPGNSSYIYRKQGNQSYKTGKPII